MTKDDYVNDPIRTVYHENVGCKRWYKNGKTKTWKRTPTRFQVPIKHGLYAYSYITELDADQFHREIDCPHQKEQ